MFKKPFPSVYFSAVIFQTVVVTVIKTSVEANQLKELGRVGHNSVSHVA